MTFTRRQILQTTSASALMAGLGQNVFAQAMNIETATIVTGFAAGGTSDTTCRRLALKLSPEYAKTAVVENRTGAGGQIAVSYVKGRPADGSTILQTPTSILTIYPHIYKKLPYDPMVDITPVSLACIFDFGFAVGPAVPASVKSVPEFLAWAKAVSGPIGDITQHLQSGKVRILGVSGAKRSRFAPDVPTFGEQGIKDMAHSEWFAFFLPAKASPELVARLNTAMKNALAQKDVIDGLGTFGLEAMSSTPAELAALLKKDTAKWAPIVKEVGFTAEG
jgi:tripartite-type tricarboxylate transporter receptor subunit TctC